MERNDIKASKSSVAFKAAFFVYIVVALLVVQFDLGDTKWGNDLANSVSAFFNVIGATARITDSPASAAIVLLLAWGLIPVQYVLILKMVLAAPDKVDWSRLSKPWWIVPLGWLFCISVVLVTSTTVPSDTHGMSSKIFRALESSPFFIVIWGAAVWAGVWVALVFMTLSVMAYFKKF